MVQQDHLAGLSGAEALVILFFLAMFLFNAKIRQFLNRPPRPVHPIPGEDSGILNRAKAGPDSLSSN